MIISPPWTYDDGGRVQAGFRGKANDCLTRALAIATGTDYKVIYDPTIFVGKSVDEVIKTIFVAILLVVGVVFLFLQSWRAAIITVIAIPVSLVGTFTFLYVLGISLNNLSLFGLVLDGE